MKYSIVLCMGIRIGLDPYSTPLLVVKGDYIEASLERDHKNRGHVSQNVWYKKVPLPVHWPSKGLSLAAPSPTIGDASEERNNLERNVKKREITYNQSLYIRLISVLCVKLSHT